MSEKEKTNSSPDEEALISRLTNLVFDHLSKADKEDKELNEILDAIIDGAIGSMKDAQRKGIDVYGEENGWLIKITPDGSKEKIKKLLNTRKPISKRDFNIKKSA